VLTGAGISAESGLATFRGPDGLWKNQRPENLATSEAFQRDPKLVWEWYNLMNFCKARQVKFCLCSLIVFNRCYDEEVFL